MALSTGNQNLWSDINSLYTALKSVYTKWGATWSDPTDRTNQLVQSTASSGDVYNLKAKIEALKSFAEIGNTANTGITPPSAGTLITEDPFVSMNTTISNINAVALNATNNGFNGSNNGFGFNGTNNGFGFNSTNNAFSCFSCGCNGSGFNFSFSMCTSF